MASPNTITLLTVDYHAAIGGKTPCPPPHLANAPAAGLLSLRRRTLIVCYYDRDRVVFGCPTMRISGDYWYKRDGDSLVVGCNSSTDKWYLVCKNRRWLGDVGNCSNTLTGTILCTVTGLFLRFMANKLRHYLG